MKSQGYSEPLLVDEIADDARVRRACYHLQDAIDGETRVHPRDTLLARRAHSAHLRLAPLLPLATFLLIALTFFEPPLWAVQAADRGFAGLYPSEAYPSFSLPTLSPAALLALELLLLAVLLADLLLCLTCQGVSRYCAHPTQRAAALLLLACALDVAVFPLAHRFAPLGSPWRRLAPYPSPYLRACLAVAHSARVRQQLNIMKQAWSTARDPPALPRRCGTHRPPPTLLFPQAVPSFIGVALLLLFFLGFSGWLATILFSLKTGEGQQVLPHTHTPSRSSRPVGVGVRCSRASDLTSVLLTN